MPKKYPTEERRAALGYLSMYSGNIEMVHQITSIPHRTLRRWRKQMETKAARRERKNSAADTTRSQTPNSGQLAVISPNFRSQQRDPENNMDTTGTQRQRPPVSMDTTRPLAHGQEDATDATGTQTRDDTDNSFAALPDEPSNVGVPGRVYPYPVGDEPEPEPDPQYAEFRNLRDLLMQLTKELAANLKADDPDINQRTLALTRLLDRIQRLEELIPEASQEQVIRFEYVYEGMVHDKPPGIQQALNFEAWLKERHRQKASHSD